MVGILVVGNNIPGEGSSALHGEYFAFCIPIAPSAAVTAPFFHQEVLTPVKLLVKNILLAILYWNPS